MNGHLKIEKFEPYKIEELIAFARRNPWKPTWPEDLMRRFLSELSSGPQMVIDVHDGQRVGAAVLVDKITNKGNDAILEIIGVQYPGILLNLLEIIIREAKKRLPVSRSGIEFTLHDSIALPNELATKLELEPYYQTVNMLVTGLSEREFGRTENFEEASSQEDQELYSVLTTSFKDNLETSVPNFKNWVANRRRSNDSTIYMAKLDGRIVVFLNLISLGNSTPEIRTVGVLPETRGKGIGGKSDSACVERGSPTWFQ